MKNPNAVSCFFLFLTENVLSDGGTCLKYKNCPRKRGHVEVKADITDLLRFSGLLHLKKYIDFSFCNQSTSKMTSLILH